ncbi:MULTISPECIES: hypothetical protein [Neobacillus]|uniref:Uncharacterized protein n=1 Tax=Neobacillus rhizophilus TaxID=2833579 RepID=A0A942YUU7_9BACI|nr:MULTISPECIES: hypothetical protein [Neobacillus]MBS4214378.1 hypothetical protein [Neobacillus rhizophilus]MBU8915829.1 hypothetical protein [Bacillus sp. FJAT-29953]
MHFRHFLIPALMMGAALFLPGNAFAEKGEQNGPLQSNKEMVQTSETSKNSAAQANVPSIAERAKPIEKTVQVPEQAKQNSKEAKSLPSKAAPKPVASPQPANETAKALPVQAKGNGYGLSDTKNAGKTVNTPGQEKKAAAQEKDSGFKTEQLLTYDMTENPPDYEAKDKIESPYLVSRLQPQEEEPNISNSNPAVSIEPPSPAPVEKDKAPSSREELPPVDQASNPTQRSTNSGGSSNDRVITGIGTISLVDKWFEWNKYFEMRLVQPFLTRDALLNTQWVNAPPSPPPQAAPFFKTVNRS